MKRKWLSMVLAASLCMSVLAGCGNGSAKEAESSSESSSSATVEKTSENGEDVEQTDEQKEVTNITMYMRSVDDQAAEKDVIDAMNAYSAEKIGVTIKFQSFSAGEYVDKVTMGLAAKEDIDLVWTASFAKFLDLCNQGALMDLTDLLQEYPDLYNILPEKDWESTEVGGKRYIVPNYKEAFFGYSIMTPVAMADAVKEKYGIDFNEIECDNFFEIGNYEEYILACMKEGAEMPCPNSIRFDFAPYTEKYEMIDVFPYLMEKDTHKVVLAYEIPEYADYVELMVKWNQLGIWKEEQLMSDYKFEPFMKSGSYAIAGWTTVPDNVNNASTRYSVPVYLHEAGEKYVTSSSNLGSGWAIANYSQKADACLKWLELVNTDQEFADLWVYGVEGKQYTRDENGIVTMIPDSGWTNATWKATNYMIPSLLSTEALDKKEQYKEANAEAKSTVSCGFRADMSPVSNESSAISAIVSEHNAMLVSGFYSTDKLQEIINDCKAAGSDTILAELQKQIDAFFAGK